MFCVLQVQLLLWDGPQGGQAEVMPMEKGHKGSWGLKASLRMCWRWYCLEKIPCM
jgi:hypothetical protein